jgi:hypothetical protein
MANARSREALLAFLDYCKEKGLLKAPTAEARKAAVNQVLGILSEEEAADIANIDLDDVITRFQNMHGKRYTPDSLKTYKARVRNAILDFLSYHKNPMEFRPRVTSIAKRTKAAKPASAEQLREPAAEPANTRPALSQPITTSTLPIPLRLDLTILVHGLPFDLTEGEARKIGNVIAAMATPA